MSTPLARVPVGIVIERRKTKSPWIDHVWQPIVALPGLPEAAPWSVLGSDSEATRFYGGGAEVELFRSDVPRYVENLSSGAPSLWVVLRSSGAEPPYQIVAVVANPNEGEAFTETGADLVEAVPMPMFVREMIAAFVAEHPVEETLQKRKP